MRKVLIYLLLVCFLFSACKKEKGDSEKLNKSEKQEVMENKSNRVSPPMTASDTIGGNIITINYGSPRVKGRVIWGGLVPYDTVWRTGANEATTIEFTKDVFVNGQPLKKDIYGLFTIPGKEEWEIIFSLDETQWGAFKYKEEEDALRIKAKPQATDTLMENMMFFIFPDSLHTNAGTVRLAWEKLQVDFQFENTKEE